MENQNKPNSYLALAILSTLFCCLPLGIVSIINASKVNSLFSSGDYQGAQEASDKAKKYATYGAIAGFVLMLLYAIISAMANA